MKQNDAVTGLMLAFLGIGILIAWRTGAIKALLGGDLYARPSEASQGTGIRAVADTLRSAGPSISTRSPQGGSVVASAGVPEDAYSSTRAPIISVIADPWGPGGFLDESARAARRAASQIYTPIAAEVRDRMDRLPFVTPASTSIDSSTHLVAF